MSDDAGGYRFPMIQPPERPAEKPAAPPPAPPPPIARVRVVGFDMPFLDLVGFLVKVALAAIPALIVIAILYAIGAALFAGLFLSIFHR